VYLRATVSPLIVRHAAFADPKTYLFMMLENKEINVIQCATTDTLVVKGSVTQAWWMSETMSR
jgi:hypothetical protein